MENRLVEVFVSIHLRYFQLLFSLQEFALVRSRTSGIRLQVQYLSKRLCRSLCKSTPALKKGHANPSAVKRWATKS